ncbi:hypothetical protein Hypma_010652 [Hypsizygus marmoreus]|uniref:Uncharacterized protein n=1 Tax=Hypsizygus marmoreus TaxID=39966 RepID=A0A369JJY0_HYPMA|nr:hypothetical protein Hypma_010652 [Hypsizygus marmoreus]
MIESRIPELEKVKIHVGPSNSILLFFERETIPPQPDLSTFEKAKALQKAGLVLDYPSVTEVYWEGRDELDFI